MADTDWMLWNYAAPKLTLPSRKREALFAMTNGNYRLDCSLLFHGEYGVEAQFLLDGDLHIGRRFDLKVQAVRWAEAERDARKPDGWSDATVREANSLPEPAK